MRLEQGTLSKVPIAHRQLDAPRALEDLVVNLETLAFTMLDQENRLYLAGQLGEVEALAHCRRRVRVTAEIVRAWSARMGQQDAALDVPAERCPLCPRPAVATSRKCKWHV